MVTNHFAPFFILMPINKRGLDVAQTFEIVSQKGKFGQQEANYQPLADNDVCGTCRFYLRDETSQVGQCQVVEGNINWNGTSDLYISAEEEASVSLAGQNAYEGEEENKELDTKAHLAGMNERFVPISVTSFEQLDAMEEAKELVKGMKSKTMAFAEMAENIFMNEEIEDKAAALQSLAAEFSERVSNPMDDKEINNSKIINKDVTGIRHDFVETSLLTKEQEMHYKAVQANDAKALDIDFQGGCDSCGFGTSEIIKSLEKCPFCGN